MASIRGPALRLNAWCRLLGLSFWLPATLFLTLSLQAARTGDLPDSGADLFWVALALAAAPVPATRCAPDPARFQRERSGAERQSNRRLSRAGR